jgi:Tol biopolymer transport system component
MMRIKIIITFSLLRIITVTTIAQKNIIDYFGQTPPDDSAVVFAPGIISLPDRNEQNIVFSPDGRECFFGEWAADYSYAKIYYTQYKEKKWTPPVEASFSIGHFTSSVFLSPDGNRLYFHYASYSGSEPYDIWMVQRTSEGWSEPKHLPSPINSDYRDGCYSETRDSIVYFASNRTGGFDKKGDIWRAHLVSGSIIVENLGEIVNSSAWESGACISPDESYLIFTSERPGGIGFSDLYITFRKNDNSWTLPFNMEMNGVGINLKNAGTGSANLSPDGRFLFFSRSGDIYWISTTIIDDIKKAAFNPKIAK